MGFGVWGLGFGVWGLGFGVFGASAWTTGVLASRAQVFQGFGVLPTKSAWSQEPTDPPEMERL